MFPCLSWNVPVSACSCSAFIAHVPAPDQHAERCVITSFKGITYIPYVSIVTISKREVAVLQPLIVLATVIVGLKDIIVELATIK